MIRGIRNSVNKDNAKALVSVGEAWGMALNDRVGRVRPRCNSQCMNVEVVDDGAVFEQF